MTPGAISHTKISPEITPKHFEPARFLSCGVRAVPSLVVKGAAVAAARNMQPARTVAEHQNGLSVAERLLMSEAMHFMRSRGRPLVWLPIEAHDAGELEARKLFDRLKSDFGQMQQRAASPRYNLEVLESTYSVHANVVGPIPLGSTVSGIISRLRCSQVYGDNIGKGAKHVHDPDGLVSYLSKEATTQAHYAAGRSFRRLPGSHALGEGGGDRVRLSQQLYSDMLAAGAIEPRRRTYRVRGLQPMQQPEQPKFALIEGGQIELFAAKPVSRLYEYGGGLMPQAVAMEIRFHLKRLGMTQEKLAHATLLGRPTITNALEGRFPLSEWAARRLRETLLPPRAAANCNAVAAA
jgi:archaeosine-15-forming tRNA-guanine transglycosylase